jgi:hypothetical protein
MDKKTPNRIPGLSIYLGPEPDRTRRLNAIKSMAEQLDVSTSEMFRLIADGKLALLNGEVIVAPGPAKPK